MYRLEHWSIEDGMLYRLSGRVFNNPKFYDGCDVHTSPIMEVVCDDENSSLIVKTRSGNTYKMEYSELRLDMQEKTLACLNELNISSVKTDLIRKVAERNEKYLLTSVGEKLKPKELYLITDASMPRIGIYLREDGELVQANLTHHVGMFQDSILIRKGSDFDFSYYPKLKSDGMLGARIEPYSISNIEGIHILNKGQPLFLGLSDDGMVECVRDQETFINLREWL